MFNRSSKEPLRRASFCVFSPWVTSNPRYRVLQSCFDQYTLSAWLDPDPDAERLIRGRDVYAPKNRTLQDGGPGYWIKMQRPAEEGGLIADLSCKFRTFCENTSSLEPQSLNLVASNWQHYEGGYDFSSTGECIMRPRPQWPKKLRHTGLVQYGLGGLW